MRNIYTYLSLIHKFPTTLSETSHVYQAISTVFNKYEGEIVTTPLRAIQITTEIIVDELHIHYENMSKHERNMINQVLNITRRFFGNNIHKQLKKYV